MRLANPEWLLLIFPLLIIARLRPELRLSNPLRATVLFLTIVALINPHIARRDDSIDLWVLADRSASINDYVTKHLPEWEEILRKSRRERDSLTFIDFADVVTVRGEGDSGYFDSSPSQTRIGLAVKFALSRRAAERSSRLLLLSDGYSTDSLDGLAEALNRAEVPLDYRLINRVGERDYRVSEFRAPSRVQLNEPFLIETVIQGSDDGVVKLEILRDGRLLRTLQVTLTHGYAVARFSDSIDTQNGAVAYSARIQAEGDAQSGNNTLSLWVEPSGTQRILLISGFADDPLADTLRAQGFAVQVVAASEKKSAAMLVNAQAVILNNIGAAHLPQSILTALKFYVEEQGGGLIMIGGEQSFGSGGYFASPIDELLPVSLELRDEHRKNRSAIAVVLDRSGSMAAGVAGNLGNMTKMDLANEGAARAADIMGADDELAVIAVDSSPHIVLPMGRLGSDRSHALSLIRSVNSAGGGIFVYEGLNAGWQELGRATASQKHMILFSDAADSEEPGQYEDLLQEMTKQSATVSVIALGDESDTDAPLLKDIAQKGNGRVFFVDNAVDLPAVFSQEAVTVSRSTFVKEEATLQSTPSWRELSPRELQWLASVDGYNLTYAKPGSTVSAYTTDSYKAPLVAFWQRAQGRSAVITFPINGPYSQKVRSWRGLSSLLSTLTQYVARPTLGPGLFFRNQLTGNVLRTQVYFDQQWEQEIAQHYPKLKLSIEGEETHERDWDRLKPGQLASTVEIPSGKLVRGSIQIGQNSLPFGPLLADSGIEWRQPVETLQQLLRTAASSGGRELVDLTKAWEAPGRARQVALREPLLILLILLFLCEVLASRLNVQLSLQALKFRSLPRLPFAWSRSESKQLRHHIPIPTADDWSSSPSSASSNKNEEVEAPRETLADQEATTRKSRFSKAKHRGL